MERITSTQNSYIKQVRSLKQKKFRDALGKFMAEGEKCALEALQYGQAEALITVQPEGRPAKLAAEKGIRTIVVNEAVMQAVCDVKTPQASVAVAVRRRQEMEGPGLYVALEALADPGNLGTVIRTADAVGAAGILLSPDCCDVTSPKVVRATMGSLFHLPTLVADDFYGALEKMKGRGAYLVGGHLAGQEGGSIPESETTVILIGNEAAGLSERASGLCDLRYRIPIYGKAESLNAAVAAGILLYQVKMGG